MSTAILGSQSSLEVASYASLNSMWSLDARDTADLPLAPPGIIPNYTDPPNDGGNPVVASLLTLVLAALAVAVRIFTKVKIVRKTGLDDCKLKMSHIKLILITTDCAVLALV